MKRILILAAMASVSTSAFAAPDDSQSVAVTATVAPECSIGDPADVNFANVNIDQNAGATALLINSSGGTQNNNQNVWISCNYGAKTTISSANGGLVNPEPNDGADAADFTNVIEYRVSLTASNQVAFLTHHLFTATGTTTSRTNTDAFHDNAALRVYIFNGDNPLRPLAGTYSDVATLAVGPV